MARGRDARDRGLGRARSSPFDARRASCASRRPTIDAAFVAEVEARERVTDHDVAAFVDVVQQHIGGDRREVGALRADVVRRRGHRALRHAHAGGRPAHRRRVDALVAVLRASERTSTAIRQWPDARTACTPSRRRSAPSSRSGALQVDRDRTRLRHAREAIAVGKLSGAVGTYSNIDPAVERVGVPARSASTPVPATQVISRDRHAAVPVRVRVGRRDRRDDRDRDPPSPAHRGGRGRGGVQGGPEGLVRDAAQAQPDHRRAPLGSRAHPARQPLRRPRGREPLARARHLALVGRAGDPSRLVVARVLRAAQGRLADRRDATSTPIGCSRTSTSRYGLVFSQPVLLALVASGLDRDDAYRIVQEDAAWPAPRASRSARCSRPMSGSRSSARRARRRVQSRPVVAEHVGGVRRGGSRRVSFTKIYSGKVRDLYDVGDGTLVLVASDRMSAFDVVMRRARARQGPCAHRDERVLVRPPRRCRPQPLGRARPLPTAHRRSGRAG